MRHTSEELSLLISYLSLIGIWFVYLVQWRVLFPKSAAQRDDYTLADYDKIKQCRCHGY